MIFLTHNYSDFNFANDETKACKPLPFIEVAPLRGILQRFAMTWHSDNALKELLRAFVKTFHLDQLNHRSSYLLKIMPSYLTIFT